jgi:hypothetical protein
VVRRLGLLRMEGATCATRPCNDRLLTPAAQWLVSHDDVNLHLRWKACRCGLARYPRDQAIITGVAVTAVPCVQRQCICSIT